MISMQRRGFLVLGAIASAGVAGSSASAQTLASLADAMAGDTRFTRFLDLITRASAVEDFRQAAPITVFAPVDQAFLDAPQGLLQDLLTLGGGRGSQSAGDSSDRQRWLALINYHVVPGAFRASELAGADRRLRTRNGADIQISGAAGTLQIRNPAPAQQMGGFGAFGAQMSAGPAQVLGTETVASNGVIYPISQILWP